MSAPTPQRSELRDSGSMSKSRYTIFAARAVFDQRMTPSEKLVLAALGTYTDSDGWCHPSQATLAERLGITRQTVSSSVKKLVLLGYVETQTRTAKGRGKVGYDYRVRLDLTPEEKADVKPSRHRVQPTSAPADFGADHDPMSAQPDIPYTEEQPHKNNPKDSCSKSTPKGSNAYPPAFEATWKLWPASKRARSDKGVAFKRWQVGQKNFGEDKIHLAAQRYLALPNTRKDSYQFCCAVEVFMNGRLEGAIEALDEPEVIAPVSSGIRPNPYIQRATNA